MGSTPARSDGVPDPGVGEEFHGLIGRHPRMRRLFREIESAATLSTRTTVLIQGESGTGKELVARAIHRIGADTSEPFVGVNCGAFSRGLLDDQLFGHIPGAFTGASTTKDGVFAAAGRGTLFLDEITEIEWELQAKLLRAIQEREVFPLGSDRAVSWQARLIAATNRDIDAQVQARTFRQDLFYRINVIRLFVPPLRERLEDVPLLVHRFLETFRTAGRPRRASPEFLDCLLAHPYPGNVRELKNAVERACALGRGATLEPGDLPPEFRDAIRPGFKSLVEVEREHVIRALRLAQGKKVEAARHLDIDRNRLYRLVRKHAIGRHEYF